MNQSKRKPNNPRKQMKTQKHNGSNLWDAAKAILRVHSQQYRPTLRNKNNFKQNNLMLQVKELEKGEQTKPNVSRRRDIIKTGAEINQTEIKKTIEKNQ